MFWIFCVCAGTCNGSGQCVGKCVGVTCTSTTCQLLTCASSNGVCVPASVQPGSATQCSAAGLGANTGTCSNGQCVSKCAGNTCATLKNVCANYTCEATTGQCIIPQEAATGTLCAYQSGLAGSGRCLSGSCVSLSCYNSCPADKECVKYSCNSITDTCDAKTNERLCTVAGKSQYSGVCGDSSSSWACQPTDFKRLAAFTPGTIYSSSNRGGSWQHGFANDAGPDYGTWAGRNIAASADGTKLIAAKTGGKVWRSVDRCVMSVFEMPLPKNHLVP